MKFRWMRKIYNMYRYDRAYMSEPVWDIGGPPKELKDLVEGGYILPCRSMDLGCGRGHIVRYLQSRGFDAWGIDLSKVSIKQASSASIKEGIEPQFIEGDIFLYEPEEQFQLLTDQGLYHILPHELREQLVENIYPRYLESGGKLLLWASSTRVTLEDIQTSFKEKYHVNQITQSNLLPNRKFFHFLELAIK
jgi:trans-aconitate methyltransferase